MPAPSSTRARLITALKWTLTAVFLVLVLRRLPLGTLLERLGHMTFASVALAAAVSALQVAIAIARWWRVLRRLGERIAYRAVVSDAFVGVLYNFILPGSIGGDVVRAMRMRTRLRVGSHAWSSTIFERVIGLFTMASTASAAIAVGIDVTASLPPWVRHTTFVLTALLAAVLVFAALPFRLLVRFLGRHLPEAAKSDLVGIDADFSGELRGLGARSETFAWSVLVQVMNLVFMAVCATALGAPGHELAIVIGLPLISVLSLVPITVGGHGLREGLYVGILGALGMPGEVALALSGAFVVSSLVCSGIGALFLMFDPLARPETEA